jgi:hypothetical protein
MKVFIDPNHAFPVVFVRYYRYIEMGAMLQRDYADVPQTVVRHRSGRRCPTDAISRIIFSNFMVLRHTPPFIHFPSFLSFHYFRLLL